MYIFWDRPIFISFNSSPCFYLCPLLWILTTAAIVTLLQYNSDHVILDSLSVETWALTKSCESQWPWSLCASSFFLLLTSLQPLASCSFFKHVRDTSTSGPLHWPLRLSRMHFFQLTLSFSSSFKLLFCKSPLHDFFSNLPTKVYSSPCPPYPTFLLYFFPRCISHSDIEYLFCFLPSLTYKHLRAGFVVVFLFLFFCFSLYFPGVPRMVPGT